MFIHNLFQPLLNVMTTTIAMPMQFVQISLTHAFASVRRDLLEMELTAKVRFHIMFGYLNIFGLHAVNILYLKYILDSAIYI